MSMDGAIEWLGRRYREGDRWLVWDVVSCFRGPSYTCRGYMEAAGLCGTHGGNYRVAVLATVLKVMRGKLVSGTADVGRLSVDLGCYPLRSVAGVEHTLSELAAGYYYPMIWQQAVYPVMDIEVYVIVRTSRVCREVFRGGDFVAAMKAFERVCAAARREDRYRLVGDGLVLYRWEDGVEQVHDPTEKYWRCSPVFVKYEERRKVLLFFDGFLRRVRPGVQGEELDLSLFDRRSGVEILEAVKGSL